MNGCKYIVGKLIRMILLLAAVSVLAFILITSAPIDPLTSYIGTNSTLSDQAKEEIAEYWGLNDPLPQRYLTWASHVLRGDLGESITYKRPVAAVIGQRFAYSFVLMLLAWLLSGILGFLLGMICGNHSGGLFDRIVKFFALLFKSAPTFWVGLIILSLFAVKLGWFPIGMASSIGVAREEVSIGDLLYHMVLPALTLTLVSMSDVILYTRQGFLETAGSDFVQYAIARGETRQQVIRRHIARNIALPAITVQFASFSELFGGMALAENVFSYPGIGTATTAAALNADVPLLLGIAVISAVFVFAGNLIADILYVVVDPRMRAGKEGVREVRQEKD